jgi:hypothetical protein
VDEKLLLGCPEPHHYEVRASLANGIDHGLPMPFGLAHVDSRSQRAADLETRHRSREFLGSQGGHALLAAEKEDTPSSGLGSLQEGKDQIGSRNLGG